MKAVFGSLPEKGFYTGFDYRDELKFYQILINNSGNLEAANKTIRDRNPSLDFLR